MPKQNNDKRSADSAGNPVCLYGSLLVAWLIACMLSIYFYIRGKWRKRLADTLKNEGSL